MLSPAQPRSYNRVRAHAAPRAGPAQGRARLPGDRPAGGLADAGRRPRARAPVRRRSATSSRCSRSTACSPTRTRRAGRVPTDAGYRYFVDRLLPATARGAVAPRARADAPRGRRGDARRRPRRCRRSRTCWRSSPRRRSTPRRSATSRSCCCSRRSLMVVVITSTGGVTKRVLTFDAPVDRGLVAWAAEFLNEQLVGLGLGARKLHARLHDPSLGATERAFLDRLAPAFTELAETAEDTLYVDGAARLLSEHRFQDLGADQRADVRCSSAAWRCWPCCAPRSEERDVLVRIGAENEAPALQLAGARRRRLRPAARHLGTVSVIGPVAMDYAATIRTVREAARQLSRFIEDVYERCARDPARLLRGARRRPRRRRGRDQEGLPQARARAASRRQPPRPRRRGEVQGGRRGLRDPLRRRAPRDLRPLRPRRPARGGQAPNFEGFGSISDLFDAFFGGGGFGGRRARRPAQGGDVAISRRDHARAGR